MANSNLADEFPLVDHREEETEAAAPTADPEEIEQIEEPDEEPGRFAQLWDRLTHIGLADQVMRVGTAALSIVLALVVVWGMRNVYLQGQLAPQAGDVPSAAAAALPTATPTEAAVQLPALVLSDESGGAGGVSRSALLHTIIPSRPRVDVITYTVLQGDTLFGIADKFGLKPETILWGNNDALQDNPHLLSPDQVLNILPTNGTYHMWHEGESFTKVAEFYNVEPESIVEYPGNRFDISTFDVNNPPLEPGTWLIVPGGSRALKDWGPPAISRANPAQARYYGPGFCGAIYEGAVGVGSFVWPTTSRSISGYTYNPPIHPAIDIAGSLGNAIYATDSGVVVYSGWSNYGYGYLIVIDHGNGWQSAYAHLSAVSVTCGQSVFQGSLIGGLGSTGNSSGPHLHFELVFNGAKVNPFNFLQ